MDLFAEYFETGAPEVVWDEEEHSRKIYAEMEEIYNWWTYEWPHQEKVRANGELRVQLPTLPEEWGSMSALNPKYKETPEVASWREAGNAHHQDDEDWAAKEEEMLCRLMKIRRSLWY